MPAPNTRPVADPTAGGEDGSHQQPDTAGTTGTGPSSEYLEAARQQGAKPPIRTDEQFTQGVLTNPYNNRIDHQMNIAGHANPASEPGSTLDYQPDRTMDTHNQLVYNNELAEQSIPAAAAACGIQESDYPDCLQLKPENAAYIGLARAAFQSYVTNYGEEIACSKAEGIVESFREGFVSAKAARGAFESGVKSRTEQLPENSN